jgi:hypothetical protein
MEARILQIQFALSFIGNVIVMLQLFSSMNFGTGRSFTHPSAPTASLSNRVTHVELGVASAHASSSLKSLSYAGIGLYDYKHNALGRTDDVCFPFKRFSYLRNLSMRNKSVLSSSSLA